MEISIAKTIVPLWERLYYVAMVAGKIIIIAKTFPAKKMKQMTGVYAANASMARPDVGMTQKREVKSFKPAKTASINRHQTAN